MKNLLNQNLNKYKVLVIGDSILDKYYYGNVKRISPEAPVPINHINKCVCKLGGAANVANILYTLGLNTSIITHIGNNDEDGKILFSLFKGINIIPLRTNQRTTTKIRIIGNNQQMLRLDFEEQLNDCYQQINFNSYIEENDIIIISDYNKGFCSKKICQYIINKCNQLNKKIIIDPKGSNWNKYKNANFITPNINELNALGFNISNNDVDIENISKKVIKQFNFEGILTTRSEQGLSLYTNKIWHIPAVNVKEVQDPTGAGDVVVAIFALGLLLNINYVDILKLANLAAGITCEYIGTYTPTIKEIINKISF